LGKTKRKEKSWQAEALAGDAERNDLLHAFDVSLAA